MKQAPLALASGVIRDIINGIRNLQNDDHGFPSDSKGTESCAWATAGLLWALAETRVDYTQEWICNALRWLSEQRESGCGVPAVFKGEPSITDATASFIISLCRAFSQSEDVCYYNEAKELVSYLLSFELEEGGWPWKLDKELQRENIARTFSTALVFLAFVKFQRINRDEEMQVLLTASCARIENLFLRTQHDDGGWGTTEEEVSSSAPTGIVLYALRDSEFPKDSVAVAIDYILRTQLDNGGWEEVVERPCGHTIIRLATPYAFAAILTSPQEVPFDKVELAVACILRQIDSEGLFCVGSQIRSWPTRDGLIALTSMRVVRSVPIFSRALTGNIELRNIIDEKNLEIGNLKNEIESLKEEMKVREQQKIKRGNRRQRREVGFLRFASAVAFVYTLSITPEWAKLHFDLSESFFASYDAAYIPVACTVIPLLLFRRL